MNSQRYVPSLSGRLHATTIVACVFAARNAGATDTGIGCPKNSTHTPPFAGFTTWSTSSPTSAPSFRPSKSGRNAPSAGTISCPMALRDFISSSVIAGVPMSFATEIMRLPWRCTSCESTSQHPMCADTVTSGLCSASTSMHLAENVATDAARFIARRLVQNTCPMVRAMLR